MVGHFWHGLSNFWEGTHTLYIEQLRTIELEVTAVPMVDLEGMLQSTRRVDRGKIAERDKV